MTLKFILNNAYGEEIYLDSVRTFLERVVGAASVPRGYPGAPGKLANSCCPGCNPEHCPVQSDYHDETSDYLGLELQ